MGHGETELIQFGANGLIARRMDHSNLFGLLLPLLDQLSEHGRFRPGQKQFWPAHPGGGSSGEDDSAEAEASRSFWVARCHWLSPSFIGG